MSPCDVEKGSFSTHHETPSSYPYPLPYDERSRPHFYYGNARHRLRMSLIPERLVRMPADSV